MSYGHSISSSGSTSWVILALSPDREEVCSAALRELSPQPLAFLRSLWKSTKIENGSVTSNLIVVTRHL